MKTTKLIYISLLFNLGFASWSHAAPVYFVDPQECLNKLRWSSDLTQAQCKIRGSFVTESEGEGATVVNFTVPSLAGQPEVAGQIRPLRNGYIVRLQAPSPVSPDAIKLTLLWALGVAAPEGIAAPQGFCAKVLAEAEALTKKRPR